MIWVIILKLIVKNGQKWLAKISLRGVGLCNNNFNRAKVKILKLWKKMDLKFIDVDLVEKYNIKSLPYERLEGYMICQKI